MNFLIIFLILISHSFSKTQTDSSKIDLPEIEIYGGIDENPITTNIDVLDDTIFTKDGNNNFQDLIQSIPSLHYSGGTSRAKYFQLRGLGELSQFSGEGPPHFYVGYLVDNIDFSGIGMIGKLYDFEQIEIFKGPQTASYGPNSMAGLINLVSKKPSNEKTFNFNSSIYSKNGQSFNLSTSIPVTDNILTKITLSSDYSDGFITNISEQNDTKYDTNSKDENLAKFQIAYFPNSNLSLKYIYYNIKLDNKYDVWAPDNNGFTTYSDYQGLDVQKTKANSLNINYELNDIKLILISTFSKNDIIYSYDGDWGNSNFWSNNPYNWNLNNPDYLFPWSFSDLTNRSRESYSNELRLKTNIYYGIPLTLGFYQSKVNENDLRNGFLFGGYANNIDSKFDIYNYAVYSKISPLATDKMSLTISLRYDINETKQDLNYEFYDYYNYPYNYFYYPQYGNYKNEVKDDLIGGNVSINYKLNQYTYLNTNFSRGYKTSGINQTTNPALPDSLKIYETEYCNNFDVGFIYRDDKYDVKISAFYLDRINPQLRLSYQFGGPTNFDFATFNADEGYNHGFEINSNYLFSENLSLGFYYTYLKTYVSEFKYLGQSYGDRSLAHSPKRKYGFTFDKNLSKFLTGLSISINSNFVSSFYFEEQNNNMSASYNLVDLSLNYKYTNMNISFWSKNLTNEKYPIRGYQFSLDPISFINNEVKSYQSFGDPRTIGITIDYNL